MRFSFVLTLLCAIAALVLSVLCLLAGSSKSFLQHAELLTLNVSRIGHTSLFNTTDGSDGLLGSLVNSLEGDLNNLLSDVSSDIASALNLPDFYAVHVMDYCSGEYFPNATAHHAKENVTHCSNRTALFHFNPTQVIQDALPDGITLDDIHWPSGITDAEKAIRIASKVMVIFYIVGIAFAGLAIIGALFGIFTNGRLSAFGNLVLDFLALLTIGIASAISTALIVKAVNAINKYGKEIGIAGYKGDTFLGMTWAATAAMLLATVMSIAQCCGGSSRRNRRYGEKSY